MPQINLLDDYPLFAHVEAVIVSLHYFKLKLRDEIKTGSAPDANMPQILRHLSKELETAKVALDRHILRLEKRNKN